MKKELIIRNKILAVSFCLSICSLLLFSSCEEPEPFPNTPKIYFENLDYQEQSEDGIADSLVLYFRFEDGDGDLGLPTDDTYYPVQDYFAVGDTINGPFSISLQTFPEEQFLLIPPDLPPTNFSRNIEFNYSPDFSFKKYTTMPSYHCDNFEIVYINREKKDYFYLNTSDGKDLTGYEIDTILVERNPLRYNFHIEFFRKRGNTYEPMQVALANNPTDCVIPLNGRFPLLDDENIGNSLEGLIRYSMPHLGYKYVIKTDEFQIRFYIYDHQFNKSNIVEVPAEGLPGFTLDQLVR